MDEAAFNQATQGTTPMRDASVRQISNGFVINGQTRYVDPATKQARISIGDECVATTAEEAGAALNKFVTTGKFD